MIANLETVFGWAFRTSVEALPLALVALGLARCRQFQATWRIWLLGLFFLRLILPTVPEAGWRWSLWEKQSGAIAAAGSIASDERAGGASAVIATASFDWQTVAALGWLAGVATLSLWLIASHARLRRRVREEAEVAPRWLQVLADWARERQGVSTPVRVEVVRGPATMAIFGWWRPRLLVPADVAERYTGEQIRGMLLHEMAHVRRHDILWNWAALGLCAIHWFNPLAWLAFRRFCAERELLCDASALACLNEEERRSYGEALLRSLRIIPMTAAPSLAPFFRVHPEIKQRLLMITKPVSSTLWTRIGAALLIPALSLIVFTTSRGQSESNPQPKAAPEAGSAATGSAEKGVNSSEGERPKRSGDGERPRTGARDGDGRKAGPRDGEAKKEGARDGERSKSGVRDGDRARKGEGDEARPRRRGRDGEMKRVAAREGDGEGRRSAERDGDRPRRGESDGERKAGERDGDRPRTSAERDGEGRKTGPRDGEQVKSGPRDGEGGARKGPRDGEKGREGERSREGDRRD